MLFISTSFVKKKKKKKKNDIKRHANFGLNARPLC